MIGWLGVSIGLIGTFINTKKKIEGFYFWIISNSILIVYNFNLKIWSQVFLFSTYLILSFFGIYSWRKENE